MKHSAAYTIHLLNAEMDRTADRLLHQKLNISYNRFYFLFVINELSTPTQHAIATALGYSDPAVSTMLAELTKIDLVSVTVDPKHARRRVVTLTNKGRQTIRVALDLLDACFRDVAMRAGVDEAVFGAQANKLYAALVQKNEEIIT